MFQQRNIFCHQVRASFDLTAGLGVFLSLAWLRVDDLSLLLSLRVTGISRSLWVTGIARWWRSGGDGDWEG